MFKKWFGRDKKERENKASPAPKGAGLPLLPLHSNFATMVKTHAYFDSSTQEETWLLARCTGDAWDIISHVRKHGAEERIIKKQYDGKNRGVTYAHVLCRLAEFEHIRHNAHFIVKDENIDQATTAKHFLIVANHDGVAIDTDGKPRMSTDGEFFEGSFSDQQTKAVFGFHTNPILKPLEEKSVFQIDFEEAAEDEVLPFHKTVNALVEVETLRKVRDFLKKEYTEELNDIIAGKVGNLYVVGTFEYNFQDKKGYELLKKVNQIRKDFSDVENISEMDKTRITQILDFVRVADAMGDLHFLKLEKIPMYSEVDDKKRTHMNESEKEDMIDPLKNYLKNRLILSIQEMHEIADDDNDEDEDDEDNFSFDEDEKETDDNDDATQTANGFEKIAGTATAIEFFTAEKNKIQPIIDLLEKEIEKLNTLAVAQMNTEKLMLKDPQTGALRSFTPTGLKG